jgi:hypothetical protein
MSGEDRRPRAARRKALLKLIARMIDVDFDTLEQRDRKRRRQAQIAWSAAGVALLAVLAMLIGSWVDETRTALSQQLAKQAHDESDSHPDLALLLSVLSYRTAPTPAAFESMLATTYPRQNLLFYLQHPTSVSTVAFAPDERSLAVASCVSPSCSRSTVTRYDIGTRRALGAPISVSGKVTELRYQATADQLFVLRKGMLIARACGMANRDLSDSEIDRYLGWRKHILRTARICR